MLHPMLTSFCFVFNHFLRSQAIKPTRIEYGVEIRGCNLGAALGAIELREGEHLLRSRGTAGDLFIGFDRIFERYRLYSRHL
jgi:hypothetical protein